MGEVGLIAEAPFAALHSQGNTTVALAAQRSIASIAVFDDRLVPAQLALGLELPGPGRQARAGDILYLWAGPGSWLAIADSDDPEFARTLAANCAELAAITDQSDGRSILRISGPDARRILAKQLPIDLHPSVFAADATAMTLAGHVSVQIWRCGASAFEIACFRSFAETFYQALIEASRY